MWPCLLCTTCCVCEQYESSPTHLVTAKSHTVSIVGHSTLDIVFSVRLVQAARSERWWSALNASEKQQLSWLTPHPSVIYVALLQGIHQPSTGRLATHPSNTAVKMNKRCIKTHTHTHITSCKNIIAETDELDIMTTYCFYACLACQ